MQKNSLNLAHPLQFGRIEALNADIQDARQLQKFQVSHATELGFNLRYGCSPDIQAKQLAPSGKLFLGQSQLIADSLNLRSNNIQRTLCSSFAQNRA